MDTPDIDTIAPGTIAPVAELSSPDVNNPQYPDGDPRRNWPKLEDPYNMLPKVMETYEKGLKATGGGAHIQVGDGAGTAPDGMTIHQGNGYVPHVVYGDDGPVEFWIKLPKIAALTEFYHRMGKFETMTSAEQASPEGMRAGLEALLPLLRLLREDGTYRKVEFDEAAELIGIEDISPIVMLAFPPVNPGQELADAGIVDPKAPRRRARTGRPSTA